MLELYSSAITQICFNSGAKLSGGCSKSEWRIKLEPSAGATPYGVHVSCVGSVERRYGHGFGDVLGSSGADIFVGIFIGADFENVRTQRRATRAANFGPNSRNAVVSTLMDYRSPGGYPGRQR